MEELLLKVDGVGGDDGFAIVLQSVTDSRYEIGQRFTYAGTGLGQQSAAVLQSSGNGCCHELLLRAVLKATSAGEKSGG